MADGQDMLPDAPLDDAPEETNESNWSNLWQMPAILASLAMIGLGVYVASQRAPDNDFDSALDEVQALIGAEQLESAQNLLEEVIEPHLQYATLGQQARFYASAADWIVTSQEVEGINVQSHNEAIAEQYGRAVGIGAKLTPTQLESWGHVLIDLARIEEARERLGDLEALSATDAGDDARRRRNRLLRRLVEDSLTRPELSYDATMMVLEQYRADALLDLPDEAWVVARQAELRLESNDAPAALDHLLVDMRRLARAEELSPSLWGELYTLLGRGHYILGQYRDARYHLQEAMALLEAQEPVRGDALLILGRIEEAENELEEAYERFDEIVRNFINTRSYLPGLLSRAESQSKVSRHEESLADYNLLVESLARGHDRRDISRESVTNSLSDRHDSALTMGDLTLALRYVLVSESLFDANELPVGVVFRIGSTSRQIADNIMARALADLGEELLRPEQVDPELRFEAAGHFEKAGEYYLRHARALVATPDADERYANSLWLSGDSFDLAGQRLRAIEVFLDYSRNRPADTDPRWSEVTFRLGRAYQAQMQYEEARAAYQRLIEMHPRSTFGTQSHVPLAACLIRLDKWPEAETQLIGVVEGRHGEWAPITPDAADYREALIALGKLYYDRERYKNAIERLTTARERYPTGQRIDEVRFWLADSYRRRSLATRDDLATTPTLSPSAEQALMRGVQDDLESARRLFKETCLSYAEAPDRYRDRLELEYQRLAWLYRADCAYDLDRLEDAARLYDQAARNYSTHHSSMHALVQIVNCYDQLGDSERADIAHRNATKRLEQLPDEAFQVPDALMDRAAWERWLRNRPVGGKRIARTGSTI